MCRQCSDVLGRALLPTFYLRKSCICFDFVKLRVIRMVVRAYSLLFSALRAGNCFVDVGIILLASTLGMVSLVLEHLAGSNSHSH